MKRVKRIKREDKKRMFIETNKNGFTLWIKEANGRQHWLIDGSDVLQSGVVALGNHLKQYAHSTEVVDDFIERGVCIVVKRNN